MNHYTLRIDDAVASKAWLRAFALLFLASSEREVSRGWINAKCPFSLSNISLDPDDLVHEIYSSEFQKTIESFDKSTIVEGDLVFVVVPTNDRDQVKEFFGDYLQVKGSKILLGKKQVGPVQGTGGSGGSSGPNPDDRDGIDDEENFQECYLYIGTSNSSQSEWNFPFANYEQKIVVSIDSLTTNLLNVDFLS